MKFNSTMKYENICLTRPSVIFIVSNNWILILKYIHSKMNIIIRRNTMKISTEMID